MTRSVFPTRPADIEPEQEPRVVSFDEADAMIEALASGTARSILAALEEEPLAPAALADRVDTSLQNTLYHLERLSEADLVAVAGTSYSTRGNEMDVYAPAADPVVICVGDERSEDAVTTVLDDTRPNRDHRDPSGATPATVTPESR